VLFVLAAAVAVRHPVVWVAQAAAVAASDIKTTYQYHRELHTLW
jgi:hypothetical protein